MFIPVITMNIWFLEQYSLDPTGCWLRNWMVHSGTKMFPASSVINFTVISMRVPQTQLSYNNVLLYPLDTHWLFTPANYFRLLNFFIVFVFVVFFYMFQLTKLPCFRLLYLRVSLSVISHYMCNEMLWCNENVPCDQTGCVYMCPQEPMFQGHLKDGCSCTTS